MNSKSKLLGVLFVLLAQLAFAQNQQGKITYERKTNLYKKFHDDDPEEWIKESDKLKVDAFELYFSDSSSAFTPIESDLKDRMSWATSKNKVYQNFASGSLFTVKSIWGEEVYLRDTVKVRSWKMLPGNRKIAGFDCRKALWQQGDSIKLYAWYTNEIPVSAGPESFTGLPGMILALATENGGVIYMAKQVELSTAPTLSQLQVPKTKQKIYQADELKAKLTKDFGKERWGRAMIKENFETW